ncbi:MAG: DUF4105 domain-containing protein [Solimonas sp.]
MHVLGLVLLSLLIVVTAAWWGGALWHRLPGGRATRGGGVLVWAIIVFGVLVPLWDGRAGYAVVLYLMVSASLGVWWRSVRPSNDRVWADEVAEQLHGTLDGETVMLENVRNFAWRSRTDYDIRWETRRYDLRTLRSVDMLLSHWMGPAVAHTLVSFGFERDDGEFDYLAFSIEIRKERGEAFSALGGFFKQFEASLIAADERDIVRLRSNVRREDVYLYRLVMPDTAMRSLFLAYLAEADTLRRTPRWYNTATANCTTIVFEMARRIVGGLPFDVRLLLSGYLPEYLHRVGALVPGQDLRKLRSAARIVERALAADADPQFSQRIRAGVPGMASPGKSPTPSP